MPDKDILRKFKFFSDISTEALDSIASKCELRELKPGDTLFRFEDICVVAWLVSQAVWHLPFN